MSTTVLEDLPGELFLCIFDHFWAHQLFFSFYGLNSRIDELLSRTQLHISADNQDVIYQEHQVVSLTLTESPISLDEFVNIRSLILVQSNLIHLDRLPDRLLRLSMRNISLSSHELNLILNHPNLFNVQLNLQKRLNFSWLIDEQTLVSNSIHYLAINYISLNDLISFLPYLPRLKSLYVSLFGLNEESLVSISPLKSVTRVTCLTLSVPFNVLCSQFLSVCFPNLIFLSIYTSYVDLDVFVRSLELLLSSNYPNLKKFNVSAQIHLRRASSNDLWNLETIIRRFRTAFWLKRNARATFKYCRNDAHSIRIYLQTNAASNRIRPSRFDSWTKQSFVLIALTFSLRTFTD